MNQTNNNNSSSTMDTTLNQTTTTTTPKTSRRNHPTTNSARVFENGTIIGAITESPNAKLTGNNLIIPEIVISASYSSQSLNQKRFPATATAAPTPAEDADDEDAETAVESTALLQKQEQPQQDATATADAAAPMQHLQPKILEHFVLNRCPSESNVLDTTVYAELEFPTAVANSAAGSGAVRTNGSGRSTAAVRSNTATPSPTTVVDVLNTSNCSRESSRPAAGGKRGRRKHKTKAKRESSPPVLGTIYPPQFRAIYLDRPNGDVAGVGMAMEQVANAAATSPFLNTPGTVGDSNAYMQYYPQSTGMSRYHRTRHSPNSPHSAESGSAGPSASGSGSSNSIRTPTFSINPRLRVNFRKWFSRPSLPFVIGILALGGVACTLGGIVLGSTGLIEHSTQYLSAALLMIGIGVSLLVISGAIWRLSLPDEVDECPCYRHMESCRNCNSPYCNSRLMPGSYMYPEFQHRPPPPSYLTSLNECAAMGLLFRPAAAAAPPAAGTTVRFNTPPPLYRSTTSLSVFVPSSNSTNTVVAAPCTSIVPALPPTGGMLPEHAMLTMSAVMENLQAQQQALRKELNYPELD